MVSTSTGCRILPIDGEQLESLFAQIKDKVGYKLGAKARAGAKVGTFDQIDCSGFIRWFLPLLCDEHIDVPDGSQNQRAWCERQGFKATDYCANARWCDGRLRIAFLSQKPGKAWPRHVWLVYGKPGEERAMTMESYGGHGVGRRWWNNQAFKKVAACFVLTDVLE